MHGAQEAGDVVERRTLHAAEQDRSDVAPRREQWRQEQSGLDADRQIFIDEAWAKTNMTRLRGRAPRGQRRIDKTRTGTGSPPRSSRPWAWEACAVQRCGMVRSTATYSRPSSGRCLCQDCVLAPWTCSTTCRATRRSTRVGSSSHAGPVWSFCPPLLAGPQPHRDGPLQDQAVAPVRGLPQARFTVESDAVGHRWRHPFRRRSLLQTPWLLARSGLKSF